MNLLSHYLTLKKKEKEMIVISWQFVAF